MLGLFYAATALALGAPSTVERVVVASTAVHVAAAYATGYALASPARRRLVAGLVANGILLCYYAAPLSTMAEILATKDASSISAPLVALNGANGLLWLVYGLAVDDRLVWVPNCVGVLLALAQLGLRVGVGVPAAGAET